MERILSVLTFGLLGKPKPTNRSKGQAKSKKPRQKEPVDHGAIIAAKKRPARNRPVAVEVTSARLYVGNLDYQAQEDDLEELFRGVGTVASAEIVTNPRTQQSKGFAFIEMGHIDEARRAVNVLHDQDFMGRKLLVTGAKSAEETRADNEAAEAAAAKKAVKAALNG